MDLELEGRGALVTGSNAGIGKAIARRLAEEGARVVVHGRSADRAVRVRDEIRAAGGEAWSATADLAVDAEAEGLVEAAQHHLGHVEILVNNVGTYDFRSSWRTLTADDWLKRFNVNTVSAIRVSRLVVDVMVDAGWGRIVNIGSTDATVPDTSGPDYAASKAALANATITLAHECHGTGVTVNTVTPGLVLTDRVLAYLREIAAERSWPALHDQAIAERALQEVFGAPRGGWGQPRDVAFAVAIVCSPLAGWMTAADLRLDGGGAVPALVTGPTAPQVD
jgi:NAD(P)-dependent dehydrogenase (short-subunit alcohol dehydrogenase family)